MTSGHNRGSSRDIGMNGHVGVDGPSSLVLLGVTNFFAKGKEVGGGEGI